MTPAIWDTHVHLDFMRDAQAVAREAAELGLGLFAVTVRPEGVEQLVELSCEPNVRVGVGLHPWWVADGRCDSDAIAQAVTLAAKTRFVGEIGLDFSPKHVPEGSTDMQLAAFEAIVAACAKTSDTSARKVLSIHSVQAASAALDALERTGCLAACHCIFHWFSGSSDELHRAVKAGCWFSVNEMMLRTRRGREYARQIPEGRLLVETDLPPGEQVPFSAGAIVASLERTLEGLRTIRGTDLHTIVSENASCLMGDDECRR